MFQEYIIHPMAGNFDTGSGCNSVNVEHKFLVHQESFKVFQLTKKPTGLVSFYLNGLLCFALLSHYTCIPLACSWKRLLTLFILPTKLNNYVIPAKLCLDVKISTHLLC